MESGTGSVIGASIAATVAVGVGILTVLNNRQTLKETKAQNRRTINEIRTGERRRQLNAALSELLIPLHSYLGASYALYKIFSAGKGRIVTLIYLLDPEGYVFNGVPGGLRLTDADKKILEEIIDVGKRIEDLLMAKGGLVDDPILNKEYTPDPAKTEARPEVLKGLGLFAIAIAHFRVLRLAYSGAIKGEIDRYKDFMYPRELNDKVYDAIRKTKAELQALSATA